MQMTKKECYVYNVAKFAKWEKLTLKELMQIVDIIGGNWTLKKEAVEALESYHKDTNPKLKRIK